MTGIERLRELAGGIGPRSVWSVTRDEYDNSHGLDIEHKGGQLRDLLADIAYQIEREQDEMVADSPYDAILPEDRDALAWVRDHGGLDRVRAEWSSRVPCDLYERRRRRLLDHIAECETALGRRNVRIEELGHRVSDLTRENAELRKRAMPEGCEWPRYEDGEPVRFEDELPEFSETIYKTVKTVLFQNNGCIVIENNGGSANRRLILWKNERVKRPAVPAADGEPLREGEHVYHVEAGAELVVKKLPKPGEYQAVVVFAPPASHPTSFDPDQLTHQRPVLDADGVPIREGDTVYGTVEGGPFIVTEVSDKGSVFVDAFPDTGMHGSMLTHTKPEPPDSWEKIEEDIGKPFSDYWGCKRSKCDKCPAAVDGKRPYRRFGVDNCIIARNVDLVRRCKALAERDRGE